MRARAGCESVVGVGDDGLALEFGEHRRWRTPDEAENAIFEYIDTWYNTRRIQKELGYLSPDEYETAWLAQTEPDTLTPASTGGR